MMNTKLETIEDKLNYIIENMNEQKEVFTMEEACNYLQVGRTAFTREVNEGRVRFKLHGRKYLFKKIWLDDWMER